MNSMRIIGAANPRVTSVNRITYVLDTDEAIVYVNKSTLLGRYPNAYYAYEAVRGALMRCGCRDPQTVFKIPTETITKYTYLPTVSTQFASSVTNDLTINPIYNTWVTRFGNTTVPIVLIPEVNLDPRISLIYKLSTAAITAPVNMAAALADGFKPILSGDPILIPIGQPNNNEHRIRFALYWNLGLTTNAQSTVFTLRNAMAPSLTTHTPTTLNFTVT